MIDREHDLPITKQAEVLKISRGSRLLSAAPGVVCRLAIMQARTGLHLEFPFAGSRMCEAAGCREGARSGRRMSRRMGIEALYRRPRTTKPSPGHKIYPYLLRGMGDHAPDQVWAMDITYIPMARGFVYLAVVLVLGDPPGSVVAAVDHDGGGLLRRDTGGRSPRHGKPKSSYHQGCSSPRSLHQRARQQRHPISMDGKGACGTTCSSTAVAQRQIRGGILRGLRKR